MSTEQELPDLIAVTVAQSAPEKLALHILELGETQVARWGTQSTDEQSLSYEVPGGWNLASQIAIAPDGERVAYLADALYLWENGQVQQIPDTEQFATNGNVATLTWGEHAWQLRPRSELPLAVG